MASIWVHTSIHLAPDNLTLEKLEGLSKPVLAQVHGACLAGGFEMMLAADLVIAAEDAKIGDQS